MADNVCATCGSDVEGYKCDLCSAEADEHDEEHSCGGEHCMPKCFGCKQAEVKCSCG